MPSIRSRLYWFLIRHIYADHNSSPRVRSQIAALLRDLPAAPVVLNIGSGDERFDPRITNVDVYPGPGIDVVVESAERLPFADDTADCALAQEVLEHVPDAIAALREIARVTKPGAPIYFQVPFVIGYHPGPHDFLRFTKEGVVKLAEHAGLTADTVEISVGPATGFYRIAVEFFAILGSAPLPRLYKVLKAFFAVVLFPMKLLDMLLLRHPQRDRIAGGYLVVARKSRA